MIELTYNDMKALKQMAEAAIKDENQECYLDQIPLAKDRWRVLRRYLEGIGISFTDMGDSVYFSSLGDATATLARMQDLIEEYLKEDKLKLEQSEFNKQTRIISIAAIIVSLLTAVLGYFFASCRC